MAEKVLIATIVYGDYIEMYEQVCLRSLFQKGNIPWLIENGYDVEYLVFTKDDDSVAKIGAVIERNEREGFRFAVERFNEATNNSLLKEIIRKGIETGARVLFLNPDYYFSENALQHLVSYKSKNNMCVAATHVRVNDSAFKGALDHVKGDISAPKLVSMAMTCLHDSWGKSFVNEDENNSFISGSAIQPVGDNLWTVSFRIPTVFMANFQQSDMDFLQRFDLYDHEWPCELIKDQRFKFAGSSDFFFAVELTREFTNTPSTERGRLWNDDFHVSRLNGETNRNFLTVLRGEDG